MDGVHDSRNQLLHPAAGVREIGKLPTSNQVESSLEQGLYGAGDLPTLGQPTKFELTTGQAQGLFTQVPGQQAPIPAIVSNDYGRGKSLLFAFDLAAMMTADVVQANSQLAGLVTTSASYGASGSPTLTLGDVTQLSASINNQGTRTVSFKAEATLPAALASIATAPQAQVVTNADGSTLATWNFSLAGGATQELGWLVRAMQTGSFSVPLSIYSLPSAGSSLPPKLRVTTTFAVDVKDAASLLQQSLADECTRWSPRLRTRPTRAKALTPSARGDRPARPGQLRAGHRAVAGRGRRADRHHVGGHHSGPKRRLPGTRSHYRCAVHPALRHRGLPVSRGGKNNDHEHDHSVRPGGMRSRPQALAQASAVAGLARPRNSSQGVQPTNAT